jgi:single-stranded-DNA-specific exonuclease
MKGGVALPQNFSKRVKSAAELVKEHKSARVISHYDADGITAASIMVSCLKGAGIGLQATIMKSLELTAVTKIAEESNELVIFLDMGSGQIDGIERMGSDVVVLDHHKPIRESKSVQQINPHFFELDGMRDVSASGLAFILATAIDADNWSSAPLAITGLIGDMQNLRDYSTINASIIDGAVSRGLISRDSGPRLSGETLQDMLAGSSNPYFKGLSGRKAVSAEFLKSAGLDPDAKYGGLDENSRRKLMSLLTLRLLSQGCGSEAVDQLSGELMTISSGSLQGTRIDDLVELVNACGRMDHPGIGMAMCLGDRSALQEAAKFRSDYVNSLLLEIKTVEDGGFEPRESIQVVRPHRSSLAGAICGISMQYLLDQSKPTIAVSKVEGSVKISSRGTNELIAKGLDLAESMKKCAEPLGGVGGGHKVAAGATVPLIREDDFLKSLDEATCGQLHKGKS